MASSGSGSHVSSVLSKEGGGALQIDLHPLVIINISYHHTRAKISQGTGSSSNPNPRVVGAVIGVQEGRRLEVTNSFELTYNLVDGAVVIDFEYLKKKAEMFKKVFPSSDFLGWYSTGVEVLPADIEVHRQFLEINESPIYILIDPVQAASPANRDLPISVFESELHMVADQPTMLFAKVQYNIQTGEAERIGVDHVARMTPSGTGGSQLTSHLLAMHNAVKMLNNRVKILLNYVQNVSQKGGKVDHSVLRHLHALTNQLPAIDTQEFRDDIFREYNDVLLVTYLAGVTKGTSTFNDLVDKMNTTFEKQTRRRGYI